MKMEHMRQLLAKNINSRTVSRKLLRLGEEIVRLRLRHDELTEEIRQTQGRFDAMLRAAVDEQTEQSDESPDGEA